MRILHTNFHKGWGGQSNRILTECRGLKRLGHDVVIAVPENSELHRRAEAAGLEVFTAVKFARGLRLQHLTRDALNLRRLIRERQFEIIHTHGSQDSWAIMAALINFAPRPIVLRTKHNVFPIADHFFNRRLYGKWSDGIVCVSDHILEYCASKPYLRRENLATIHSAVDFERIEAAGDDESAREEFQLNGHYVAAIVGRLRVEKGHRYLIEAMPEIVRQIPELKLLIIGSGSLEGEFRQMIAERNLDRHVIFTGFRQDVPRLLRAVDLVIAPSVSEGLGTAIMESGAARKPIVASRVGGIPEIIEDGKSGLLFPPGDPKAIAEAVLNMHSNREFAQQCGEEAARHIQQKFGEELLGQKTAELYEQWLERRKKRQDTFR